MKPHIAQTLSDLRAEHARLTELIAVLTRYGEAVGSLPGGNEAPPVSPQIPQPDGAVPHRATGKGSVSPTPHNRPRRASASVGVRTGSVSQLACAVIAGGPGPCEWCGGKGSLDSGGITPWGAAIDLPCPHCSAKTAAGGNGGAALCSICKTPLVRAVEKELCAHCADSIPEYIWADCDPSSSPSVRWAFYRSKADQRGNRPDLRPIRLRVSYVPEEPKGMKLSRVEMLDGKPVRCYIEASVPNKSVAERYAAFRAAEPAKEAV